jgi:hypothetical protein
MTREGRLLLVEFQRYAEKKEEEINYLHNAINSFTAIKEANYAGFYSGITIDTLAVKSEIPSKKLTKIFIDEMLPHFKSELLELEKAYAELTYESWLKENK